MYTVNIDISNVIQHHDIIDIHPKKTLPGTQSFQGLSMGLFYALHLRTTTWIFQDDGCRQKGIHIRYGWMSDVGI